MSLLRPHEQLLDDCQRYWSASAAKLYRLGKTSVEQQADGIHVTDHTGKRFIDCACSYGVFIVGHRNPMVREQVQAQLNQMAWVPEGRRHPLQDKLTERLCQLVPGSGGTCSTWSRGLRPSSRACAMRCASSRAVAGSW
ncbi:aminotransferase class III-fold pyridoxal phosphate-dependent enzyme [Pseudomonas corrugata]